jgi:hypothetical protein
MWRNLKEEILSDDVMEYENWNSAKMGDIQSSQT